MRIKEKISLETIGDKKFRVRLFEAEDNKEAILTHYLQNFKSNDVPDILKKEAIKVTKEILNVEFPKENLSLEAAEEALQYGIFNDFNIPFPSINKPAFKFIDLFAGIGGFRLAFQNLGGKCVYSSEWDKYSKQTYKANFGE